MNVERLKQYISKATFAHGADRNAVMQMLDEINAQLSKMYTIGDNTSERVFKASGLTNISDLQAVFDAVESALIAQASAAPEQEAVAWIDPVALESAGPVYDAGFRDGCAEAKRLNAHADPSELERLRADVARLSGGNQLLLGDLERRDATVDNLRQKLAEAQALLRERDRLIVEAYHLADMHLKGDAPNMADRNARALMVAIEKLPSATAQPAECATCNGSEVVATTDRDHEGNTIECRCPMCDQPAEVKS